MKLYIEATSINGKPTKLEEFAGKVSADQAAAYNAILVHLGDRLGRAGWLNVYVPDAEVVHTGGHATAQSS